MRRVLLGIVAAVGAASCAHGQGPDRTPAPPPAPAIAMDEQSNVCVWVHVDQAVWPTPHLPDADQNFSTFFSGEMARVYREQGGQHHLPGPNQVPRFQADWNDANPFCRDAGRDIAIHLLYAARPDGKPFLGSYRIVRGDSVRTGAFTRDIEEEWRSGRLERPPLSEPLQIAVTDDMRDRARLFIRLLKGE
jgi:hypothetical protein